MLAYNFHRKNEYLFLINFQFRQKSNYCIQSFNKDLKMYFSSLISEILVICCLIGFERYQEADTGLGYKASYLIEGYS